jgi:quinol monooxygenase YgiN
MKHILKTAATLALLTPAALFASAQLVEDGNPTSSHILAIVQLEGKDAENTESILAELKQRLPETRTYPGAISVKTYRDKDNPNLVIVTEEWESRDQFNAYNQWRTDRGDYARILAFELDGAPTVNVFGVRSE